MIAIIRQIILCVTAASLFGSVALALVPDGALKEVIRMGVGLVLILSLVVPLRRVLPLSLPELVPQTQLSQQEEAGDVYRQAVRQQVEAEAAQYVIQQAGAAGISCTAHATAEIAEDGTVSVTAVHIALDDTASGSEIAALRRQISTQLGVPESAIVAE